MNTNDTNQIIRLAYLLASTNNHALSTVSLQIANHGSLFGRIERGESDVTTSRRDRIFKQFSDHWPTDLEWPSDISRPPVSTPDDKEAA